MRVVLVFPPSESSSNLVRTLSRYGAMIFFQVFLASDWTTFPSVLRLRLILLCSYICCSFKISSVMIFSDPARSHRFSLARVNLPFISGFTLSMINQNTECDLDELILDRVYLVTRLHSPRWRRVKQSSELSTTYSVRPSTKTPCPVTVSFLILRGLPPPLSRLSSVSWRRSQSFSLQI